MQLGEVLLELDQARGDQAVEDLAGLEGARCPRPTAISSIERRSSILQITAHSCGVNDTEVFELFWREHRHQPGRRDALGEHLPLVDPPRRLHQEVGVGLLDRRRRRVLAGGEDELALRPDGELVDRLLADQVADLRVDDLAVLQVDVAGLGAVLQREDAGLARHRHQLDDVGKRQLLERTLECHLGSVNSREPASSAITIDPGRDGPIVVHGAHQARKLDQHGAAHCAAARSSGRRAAKQSATASASAASAASRLGAGQQHGDHARHLVLVGAAVAGDGALHLGGRVLLDRPPRGRRGSRAARRAPRRARSASAS